MGRRTREETEELRRQIVRAALRAFADRGFHATSVAQIAKDVGLSKQALMHHFPSKQALLEAIQAIVQRSMLDALPRMIRALSAPEDQVGSLIGEVSDYLEEHLYISRFLLREIAFDRQTDIVLGGGGEAMSRLLGTMLAQGQKEGRVDPDLDVDAAKGALEAASGEVEAYTGDDPAQKARLELARDEKLREMQDEEKRYQIAKDLSDNLTIGYNTSEVIMARLVQTTNAKERVYAQSVSFFSTNESVLTALNASFTGLQGLHESTETLNAMKDGINKSLETLADIGDEVQKKALEAGYGPTVAAASVKKLVDSVVNFQVQSREIIDEMREMSTKNSEEIRNAVEDGKRRIARLAEEGNALLLEEPAA